MTERRGIADFEVESTADAITFYKGKRKVLVVPRSEWRKVKNAAVYVSEEEKV